MAKITKGHIICTKDCETGDQLDISGAELVEVNIRRDGKVVWINVDGICRLRVCQITKLKLRDER